MYVKSIYIYIHTYIDTYIPLARIFACHYQLTWRRSSPHRLCCCSQCCCPKILFHPHDWATKCGSASLLQHLPCPNWELSATSGDYSVLKSCILKVWTRLATIASMLWSIFSAWFWQTRLGVSTTCWLIQNFGLSLQHNVRQPGTSVLLWWDCWDMSSNVLGCPRIAVEGGKQGKESYERACL